VSQQVGPDAVMSQAKAKAVPFGLDRFSRPGRCESTANLARNDAASPHLLDLAKEIA